jgi:23S rRNA pseudouridine2605 synthase
VNGESVTDPDRWIDLNSASVVVKGRKAGGVEHTTVMMNKPAGVITTRSDELGRKTVFGTLPARWGHLMPVGRLDKDSSGLLLFSNDTQLANRLTDPVSHAEKEYVLEIDRPLADADARAMGLGMVLEDGTSLLPARVAVMENSERFSITITEGKNRQLRRMMTQLGYSVNKLKRIRIGNLRLGDLAEGQTKELAPRDVALLERLPGKRTRRRT